MNSKLTPARLGFLSLVAAGAFAAATQSSLAGECPADLIVADSNMQTDMSAKGVTDTVIGAIDLANEAPMLDNRMFRLRRLEIEAGGVVPWHSHGERPAIIYIVSGEIVEHSSTCAVPILQRAGEVSLETHPVSHWWENVSGAPVVLLSADILHVEGDDKTM